MKTTTLTAAQKEKLSAAIKQALDHTLSVDNTAAYPRPKVEPADAFNVLDPNKNSAVDNTYIVIDNIPATYLVSFSGTVITRSNRPLPRERKSGSRSPLPLSLQRVKPSLNRSSSFIRCSIQMSQEASGPSPFNSPCASTFARPIQSRSLPRH